MFYVEYPARFLRRRLSLHRFSFIVASLLLIAVQCLAQSSSYQREFDTGDKLSVSIKNRNGRVTVIASEESANKARIEASSDGQRRRAGGARGGSTGSSGSRRGSGPETHAAGAGEGPSVALR